MVEFIVLPFPFPRKLKIWSFHVVTSCAGTAKKCTKKRDSRAELLFGSLNLLLVSRSSCRRLCSFVRSLLATTTATRTSKQQYPLGLLSKTTSLHVHHSFLHISLSLLHDYDVKMPNFMFYGGRKQATTKFSFSFSFSF